MPNTLTRLFDRLGLHVKSARSREGKLVGYNVRFGGRQSVGGSGDIVSGLHNGRPHAFFVVDHDDSIQREHSNGKFYEPEELDIMLRHFKGGTFADIGSNVGNHAIFMLLHGRADGVIAFEPNPAAYRILLLNAALNGVGSQLVHYAVGLSDTAGRASLSHIDNNLGGTHLSDIGAEGEVQVEAGDAILKDTLVSFLKIDVEGLEIEVLNGLAETI